MIEKIFPYNDESLDTYSCNFRVTKQIVSDFADLTGDKSSLHTEESFGRKSMYRENVIHGMLPVCFIAKFLIDEQLTHNKLNQVSATFLKPVLVNDELQLTIREVTSQDDEHQRKFEFKIVNDKNQVLVTIGRFALNITTGDYVRFERSRVNISNDSCVVMDELNEKKLQFSQIVKGYKSQFRFCIGCEHVDRFISILSKGLGINVACAHDFTNSTSILSLLANCVLSTSVGMCIPGRDATFIDFSTTLIHNIELNKVYVFKAAVGFKSDSTKMIVKRFTISEESNTNLKVAEGSIKVKADYKDIQMPKIDELREAAMDMGLKNKVVLITGASRGIGETAAKLFALHGAKVAINYFKGEEDADRIVDEILAAGGEAFAVQCDVSDRDQVHQMILEVEQQYRGIDILVNNAVRNASPAAFTEQSWDEFQKDIDVIFKGAFNCCQEVIPLMKERGGGKIVNVTTVYTDEPIANQSKYISSKSALVGLSRSLAVELAPENIQVNMVVPSIVQTDLSKNVSDMFMEGMANDTPMRRNATPIDVAQSIVFLSSKMASFTTGQKIMVTGGKGPFH